MTTPNEYQPNVWLRVSINNNSLLKGTEDLIAELKSSYPVQFRKEWYPAAYVGTEIVFQFFAEMSFASFLTDVVFAGIAWDLTKSIFSKAWDAITSYVHKNENYDIQHLDFTFDDITIRVNYVMPDNFESLMRLFQQLHSHIRYLHDNEVNNVSKITLPVLGEELAELGEFSDVYDGTDFTTCIWRIDYDLGLNRCYYNCYTKAFL